MFTKTVVVGLLGLSALLFFAFAITFFMLNQHLKCSAALKTVLEKLPRNRVVGSIFAVIALFWCYPNIVPLFDSSSVMQNLLLPLLIFVAVVSCIFADHLFARALASIFILNAHTLLKWVYPLNPHGYCFFAALIMSLGLAGIILAAKPYWLRLWFHKAYDNSKLRTISICYFCLMATSCLIIAMECWK